MTRQARRARGFTLVEAAIVLAVTAILTAAAWPTWREQLLRSRRIEAAAALQRLQWAQSSHHASFGRYADRLEQLPGSPRAIIDGGHYRLRLESDGADGYRAVASALAAQADDRDCTEIELRVRGAISEQRPSARCWLP